MTKYTCIDSFCGAGGLGLGLKRSGFDILLSFDIDKLCIDTINRNQKYFNHPAMVANCLSSATLIVASCSFWREGLHARVFQFKEEVAILIPETNWY